MIVGSRYSFGSIERLMLLFCLVRKRFRKIAWTPTAGNSPNRYRTKSGKATPSKFWYRSKEYEGVLQMIAKKISWRIKLNDPIFFYPHFLCCQKIETQKKGWKKRIWSLWKWPFSAKYFFFFIFFWHSFLMRISFRRIEDHDYH